MTLKTLATVACVSLAAASASSAATFDYSYTFGDSSEVTGSLDGTLLADGDTINIDALGSIYFNGALLLGSPVDTTFNGLGSVSVFRVSGIGVDFIFSNGIDIPPFFEIPPVFAISTSFGNSATVADQAGQFAAGDFPFDSARWTVTERVSPVPLPAGGLLLLSAFGGVAALKRRKKRAA